MRPCTELFVDWKKTERMHETHIQFVNQSHRFQNHEKKNCEEHTFDVTGSHKTTIIRLMRERKRDVEMSTIVVYDRCKAIARFPCELAVVVVFFFYCFRFLNLLSVVLLAAFCFASPSLTPHLVNAVFGILSRFFNTLFLHVSFLFSFSFLFFFLFCAAILFVVAVVVVGGGVF